MGNQTAKIKVAIIDETRQYQIFQSLNNDDRFKCKTYFTFQSFLQNQSLKQLSCILLKQSNNKSNDLSRQTFRMQQNENDLNSIFSHSKSKQHQSTQNKLISYLKKYSLQRLNLYLLVNDITDFKISDYHAPYISLVADRITPIKEQMLTAKQKKITNVKLKRMVKDLYRKIMVKAIIRHKYGAIDEWKSKFKQNQVTYEFYTSVVQFGKSTVSTFCQYLVCEQIDLLELIQFTKANDIGSKIILYETQNRISSQNQKIEGSNKRQTTWSTDSDIDIIIAKILRCSNNIPQAKSMLSRNTIVMVQSCYLQENIQTISKLLWEKMGEDKFSTLNFHIITTTSDMIKYMNQSCYSFVILMDSNPNNAEKIKKIIRLNQYHLRSHLVILPISINSEKTAQNDLLERVQYMVDEIKYIIKFQIAPLDSITLFNPSKDQYNFFKNKMGLKTHVIKNIVELQTSYLPPNFIKIIDSFHLVCHIKDYENYIGGILQSQKYKQTYISRINIILYDSEQQIQKFYLKRKNTNPISSKRIVMKHFLLQKIENYLMYTQVPKVSMPFFVKHSLSRFLEASSKMDESRRSGLFSLNATLVTKNSMLKEVFEDNTFNLSTKIEMSFLRFAHSNRNSAFQLQIFQNNYIRRYAQLWRAGYSLIRQDFQQKYNNIEVLKDDIKQCFYKCKAYEIIKITDDQFDYFYIKQIDKCNTLIDLQIACIYIYSLPHGFMETIEDVFRHPQNTNLAIKIFCHFVIILLTNFCSFNDEIMDKKLLIVYVQDERIYHIFNWLKNGDYVYNIGFLHCGKNQDPNQNKKNNRIIFEFENIPFLQKSRIKNLLHVENFSFYKEAGEFLIPPFTKFQVKKLTHVDQTYEIYLSAVHEENEKGFIQQIFEVNSLNEQKLGRMISDEVLKIYESDNFGQNVYNNVSTNSMFQKTQILDLYEEKIQLVKSIKKGMIYDQFYQAYQQKLYFSAQRALWIKMNNKTNLMQSLFKRTPIQESYEHNMLGVQKALLYYKKSQYNSSITELQKVEKYLRQEQALCEKNWVLMRVVSINEAVKNTYSHRAQFLNNVEKTKKWRIVPIEDQGQIIFNMLEKPEKWVVNYQPKAELFTISNQNNLDEKLQPFEVHHQFGTIGLPSKNYLYKLYNENQIPDRENFQKDTLLSLQLKQKLFQHRSLKQSNFQSDYINSEKKNSQNNDSSFPFLFGGKQLSKQSIDEKKYQSTKTKSIHQNNKKIGLIIQEDLQKDRQQDQAKENCILAPEIKSYKKIDQQIKNINNENQFTMVNEILKIQQKKSQLKSQIRFYPEQLHSFERALDISQKIQWQVFYYDNDFKLIRKYKHFKSKINGLGSHFEIKRSPESSFIIKQ